MNGQHINVKFSETPCPDTSKDAGVDADCCATTHTNGAYLSGHCVTFYPRILEEPDLGEQERKVIHELAHIITDAQKRLVRRCIADKFVTWSEITDANERATDWIANILWALYDPS